MQENTYIVDENTMAFIPTFDGTGKVGTYILEVGSFKRCSMNPLELIDYNLRFFASSLKGAGEGTRHLLGDVHKYPIILNLKRLLVWLPTMSQKNKECVWIALDHIKNYKKHNHNNTKIHFTNGSSIILPISLLSFEKRMHRAYELKFRLEFHAKFLQIPQSVKNNFFQCNIVKEADDMNYKISMMDKKNHIIPNT